MRTYVREIGRSVQAWFAICSPPVGATTRSHAGPGCPGARSRNGATLSASAGGPGTGLTGAPDGPIYCYLLGLYLGDGHIAYRDDRPRSFRLYLDDNYPE